MQTSAPATSGETPWLLFVGILTMALVPALSAFVRLQEFNKDLDWVTKKVADVEGQSKRSGIEVDSLDNRLSHLQGHVLQNVGKQLGGVPALQEKLAAATAALDELRQGLEGHQALAPQVAAMAKEVEEAGAKLEMVEKALGDRPTRTEQHKILQEELKGQVDRLKDAAQSEVPQRIDAVAGPIKKAVDDLTARTAADKAALEQALAAERGKVEALTQQVAALSAKLDELAKKLPEKPADPPKEPEKPAEPPK